MFNQRNVQKQKDFLNSKNMVSNSALKKNKLTFTLVSETDRFQNLYRLISYFRISSKKSVNITIQQMVKFDVLSASFIFLLTLFYSFKARYKKEIYSFLIGQNLPGITNLYQKPFKETSKYVFSSQEEPFLGEFQFDLNTNLIEHRLTNFYQNKTIRLKKKQALDTETIIFNGKTIPNFYPVNSCIPGMIAATPPWFAPSCKANDNFEKNGKFIPSIYRQTKFFNKNKIKTTVYNTNLSSSYTLPFQSFITKNLAFSTIKKLEKEGTYFKFSELPLNYDFYFGIFQKKDVTSELGGVRQNIFKLPQKRNYRTSQAVATGAGLQNKICNKSQLFLTKVEVQNRAKIQKQNKIITENLFEKSQKNWFYLDQNKSLQTQWFSLYKNNLFNKYSDNLRHKNNFSKFKTQPVLLDELFSTFYDVNNLSKSLTLPPAKAASHIINQDSLVNPCEARFAPSSEANHFVQQNVSNSKRDLSKRQTEINSVVKKKEAFTSANWWHLIFSRGFSLNSNFIVENINFPFSKWTKSSIFASKKQGIDLAKGKIQFSYKKLRLDQKWRKTNYHYYLQLDEFPSKLGSIMVAEPQLPQAMPSEILANPRHHASTIDTSLSFDEVKTKFSEGKPPLIESVAKTKGTVSNSLKKKKKSFAIKQKFVLRGSKYLLNFSKLTSLKDAKRASHGFTEENENCLDLQNKLTTSVNPVPRSEINEKLSLKEVHLVEKGQSKTFYLSPKSLKLRLLKKEIKAIFSSSKHHSYFIKKEKKTFNLLSNRLLTSLDEILLGNSKFSRNENSVSGTETLDTLFEFLPQKEYSTNRGSRLLAKHKILHNIDKNEKNLFYQNFVKHNTEKTLFLGEDSQANLGLPKENSENANLVNLNGKLKLKENLKLNTKRFNQLLQNFWSKKEEVSYKETFDEKTKENWLTFFIKYLSTQPRLMSGHQFPDLKGKEINKLIKYSDSKKVLINKTHFIREISSFINDLRKDTVYKFQNGSWSIFSKKDIYPQSPIDVYLPNNYIQRLSQGKSTCLQKNLFFDKKIGAQTTIGLEIKLPQAINLIELNKSSKPSKMLTLGEAENEVYQTKLGKNLVLQNKILDINLDRGGLYSCKARLAPVLSFYSAKTNFSEGKPPFYFIKLSESQAKPLKFLSKSLKLENNTEKQSFFVYQIPALLKIPSIWNPRLQKLQIAETTNKSKYTASSIDFSKNLLSSTNFLTDRKQHFFAIGNQLEKEQENSFIQKPLSGSLFGLSSNREDFLTNKIETSSNLQTAPSFAFSREGTTSVESGPLFEVKLQKPRLQNPFGRRRLVSSKLTEEGKTFNLTRKDFSILPLLSKATVRENDFFANQFSFAPIMPSLHTGSNFLFSEKNYKDVSKEANRISRTLLTSSKIYKSYPKSFKPITGINFYCFFDISTFHSLKEANFQTKTDTFLNTCPSDSETSTDLTQNHYNFERLPLTKKIIENSKLNIKRKQLSDKCDKQINTLQLVLPFLETDTFTTTWTKWLSSRYKKPAISYRFQKKVFYLPSNKKVDFFLQQKNRYQKNKWGDVEQQENRSKKGERDEDSLTSFSEQVYLPLTIKRSIHFPSTSKILQSKNPKFSFFTIKPLFSQGNNKRSKLLVSNLEKKNLNVIACEQGVDSEKKPKEMFQGIEDILYRRSGDQDFVEASFLQRENQGFEKPLFSRSENEGIEDGSRQRRQGVEQNKTQKQNNFFSKDFTKQNLVVPFLTSKKPSLSSANLQKEGNALFLPYKKLSFLPKNVWQERKNVDSLFWKNKTKKNLCLLDSSHEKGCSVTQVPPISSFLSDTIQKGQTSLSYLKRLDTNCDRLDWQFYQWSPFLHKKYTYLPPSQSTLNEDFLNSFFKNKIKKKNSIYKYSRNFSILKFNYVKSKRLKDLLPKVSTPFLFSQKDNSLDSWKQNNLANFTPERDSSTQKVSNSKFLPSETLASLHFAEQNIHKGNETLSTFRKAYSFSHLQNKQSFFNTFFPKKKRTDVCWEPITIRSWMVITQYCYAFFLVQSALYVYEKHMKKVLLSFAPLLSGRGILSGIPSFGEKLQEFLGGSTIDKNVLLFKKVPKRFQDIVAIDNKLPQLSEIVWFLRNFGRTANVNKIQGVLFVGPPGTGKTLLVQAIAGEAEVPVLVLSGSSFADGKKDKKGGQLLKRVFQRARILAPSILFIDEIDTLGESRSHFAQDDRDQKNESSKIIESISHTERKIQGKTSFSQNIENQSVKQVGLLTQFLVEMDGLARQQKSSYLFNNKITLGKPGGILVIGSTNRPKVLDPALTRPGRFDQVFYLSNPGKQKRIEILKVYTKNIGVSPSFPWDYLGDRTLGFSAADLSAIVNKSTIQAILSHTIHTIQSIENGIESLPKLSQNQNKSIISGENEIFTSFLSLKSRKYNNGNTILCKSISISLLICIKRLDLQNKYKSFNFWTNQSKSYQNSIFKLSQRGSIPSKFVNSRTPDRAPNGGSDNGLRKIEKVLASQEGANHDFSKQGIATQSPNGRSNTFVFAEQKLREQEPLTNLNSQKKKAPDFPTENPSIEFDHSLGIGSSFLSRLSFYQAGKVMVQTLFFKNSLVTKPQLIFDPMPLVATLWPKQELAFLNMFKESIHIREVTNRNQLETRLINGYAGKAAETLLISGLQFYKNNKATVTWQSTLAVEEWKFTNSLACSMISKYRFYSQKTATQRENFIALSQNSNEILETENFKILQNIFSKEELKFSQEKQHLESSEGQNDILNRIGENTSLLNPITWVSNLYQQYEITKIFGHIEENNWYQVYLPPLVKDEQNKEWVPLDQYYFGRENLIGLIWNTYKNKSINWSDIYQLDSDLTYQGLVLSHFNKAISLLDQNRELLDLFANLLISFRTIRRHEILRVFSYFKYYNPDS